MSVQVQHRRDTNANIEAVTPAVAELGYDTTKKEALIGDGTTAGGVRIAKKNIRDILIPAQITANQNDYNPTGLKHAGTLIISTDASRNITGLVPTTVTDATDGREITIYNSGSFNAVLQDQNASSSAANRFDLGGADVTLGSKQSLTLRYRTQGTLNRWELIASTAGQGVADAAVSARKLATSALGGRSGMINGTIAESRAGGAATFALKTLAGTDPSVSDPVLFVFNTGAGGYVVRSVTAALSLVISSGSSLGASNSVPFKLHVVGIDNAGTVELGVVNCVNLGTFDVMVLHEGLPYTSTAEGGAGGADSTQTLYSATARSSKYICLVGYAAYETGLAAAGTWNAAPTSMGLHGHGISRPGEIVKEFAAETASVFSGTTVIPFDDTIPQSSEGDQYMTLAVLPKFASHILDVMVDASVSNSNSNNVVAALFQDSQTGAFGAKGQTVTANDLYQVAFSKRVQAAATSTTLKLRIGGGSAGTVTINGTATARRLGGVMFSCLRALEIAT
ncbi:hypothetical protein [Bradyrhizobium sp. 76]|uniref:hyaluronate lyase N-terminal domain-containing protein n=1 Tax=Bradyrhizobium sp. 76 TaxID=2782680 RepID=UPI001FFBC050|nr:hypothetical protein [Bradyrhizobium sp. 76]MCK1407668.1 hypothetical protein [Bradyrhizobium sp. 76]